MTKSSFLTIAALTAVVALGLGSAAHAQQAVPVATPDVEPVAAVASHASTAADSAAATSAAVARGKYLVTIMVCNDCHTPLAMTPRGPAPDMARMLSGHPQDFPVTAPHEPGKGPWAWSATATNTAFSGPWGVSFTANLTPDPETGLGTWTADTFVTALRTGRHEGIGRPILPPMPYPMIGQATDEDLRAIFAYLQSIPPIRNRVPAPIDPPEIR